MKKKLNFLCSCFFPAQEEWGTPARAPGRFQTAPACERSRASPRPGLLLPLRFVITDAADVNSFLKRPHFYGLAWIQQHPPQRIHPTTSL